MTSTQGQPEPDPIEAALAAQLEVIWLGHRPRILADIETLAGHLEGAGEAAALRASGLAAAASLAHDLAGICGALARPLAARCFRAVEHGARSAVGSDAAAGIPAQLAAGRAYVMSAPA